MGKKIKLGNQGKVDTLAVEIGQKTYNIPLAGSMKRKDLMKLTDEESVFQMFAKYIPAEVLDELSMNDYRQLAEAWTEANEENGETSLGE